MAYFLKNSVLVLSHALVLFSLASLKGADGFFFLVDHVAIITQINLLTCNVLVRDRKLRGLVLQSQLTLVLQHMLLYMRLTVGTNSWSLPVGVQVARGALIYERSSIARVLSI